MREAKQGGRYKPDSVVGDHLSGTAVASGLKLPTREFAARRHYGASHASLSYLALLRTGFAVPVRSPGTAVGSYPTISPLPTVAGGIFSVALSVGLPLLDVIQRSALWSPDFPRASQTGPRSPPPPHCVLVSNLNYHLKNTIIPLSLPVNYFLCLSSPSTPQYPAR